MRHRPAARPEPGAADLVRVGLARHPVRQVRDAAGMRRRGPAREARDREVGRAPEEMHRAALADEARAEALEARGRACTSTRQKRCRVLGVVARVRRRRDRSGSASAISLGMREMSTCMPSCSSSAMSCAIERGHRLRLAARSRRSRAVARLRTISRWSTKSKSIWKRARRRAGSATSSGRAPSRRA